MVDNRLIADLTAKLVDLQRQDSDLAVTFRPDYPIRQRNAGQIAQIRSSIEAENARVISVIRSEYSAAQEREQLLAAELEKQRNVVNKVNEDIIQYAIYKGDAESVRQLYDGLEKRLKEASVSRRFNGVQYTDCRPRRSACFPCATAKGVKYIF